MVSRLDERQWERGEYRISCDQDDVDVDAVHAYLSRAYWSEGIPRATVERALANSICISLLHRGRQVGFARVVTDRATFAYLCDVYVLEGHRGLGLGKWLVASARAHPDVVGVRRYVLVTRDAQGMYAGLGFAPLSDPGGFMEISRPGMYLQDAG